ncbi:type 2 lanthipeptide synthetase LanM family protein [Oscillatoria sp. CS-180]|uniref:type 2 lanthipeptide synthetase LanM family protein n=1 Tax=Oscillatoria sp. CS-180 TaxID=3021720 RepID=UPI00232B4EFB|nr:type 2 lanthipeptide synthetase LanM family protein [Oscillatoria sp. CS-180]MDB9524589.1 type 2 lanthipeptide synthetase LanM family protein [Oscillatoria sp. CS-180]
MASSLKTLSQEKVLTNTSTKVTDDYFLAVAARASYLTEILPAIRNWEQVQKTEASTVALSTEQQEEFERRLDFWCGQVFKGDPIKFQRRLNWDHITPDMVQRILLQGDQIKPDYLPAWTTTLAQIMAVARGFRPEDYPDLPQPPDPVPFQELCLPAIAVAQQRFKSQVGQYESLLSSEAWESVCLALLDAIAQIATPTLMVLFNESRSARRPLALFFLTSVQREPGTDLYRSFIEKHLTDGMASLFAEHSALGRLMATLVDLWVEATDEFLSRLQQDWTRIEQQFASGQPLRRVTAIQSNLSDPHEGRRTVAILTFESGLKVVYKPKPLGLAATFNQLLEWCNQHSSLLPFQYPKVLDCNNYGWVEWVDYRPCETEDAVQRFYERQGMLLCLVDILEGNDFHAENILACGEFPMLVDLETLLVPPVVRPVIDQSNIYIELGTKVNTSVLRTSLLPNQSLSLNRNHLLIDVSGLGTGEELHPVTIAWRNVNTDGMTIQTEPSEASHNLKDNLPVLGTAQVYPDRYVEDIAQGFVRMYQTLITHRDELLGSESPLDNFKGQISRVLFRNTTVYTSLLSASFAPQLMQAGVARSLKLDILSRAFLSQDQKAQQWPLFQAEKHCLEQLDIPSFTGTTDSTDLYCNGEVIIENFFPYCSFDAVIKRLKALNEEELEFQKQIILLSLYSRYQKEPRLPEAAEATSQTQGGYPPLIGSASATNATPRSQKLLAAATTLAERLCQSAAWNPDHTMAAWVGINYAHYNQSFFVGASDVGLYSGMGGMGLFFAALAQVTGERTWHEMALAAVAGIRQSLSSQRKELLKKSMRWSEIGRADRLQSGIYALTRMGDLLQDPTLIDDAHRIASLITPETIARDQQFDWIGGSAGTLVHLLTLLPYLEGERRQQVLNTAIACGEHLLAHQTGPENGPKAWKTWREKKLTGYSQGAAGIADALLRLFAVTQDDRFRSAAVEAIAYEQTQFSEASQNWLDLRSSDGTCQVSWAQGAPGIALGRMNGLSVVNTPEIRQQIDVALNTTQNALVWGIDSLAWGTLGRVEVLLQASQVLGRPELLQSAYDAAEQVLDQAQQTGTFTLFQNFPSNVAYPGFFYGRAGIGYELLRLAHPDRLPSVLSLH